MLTPSHFVARDFRAEALRLDACQGSFFFFAECKPDVIETDAQQCSQAQNHRKLRPLTSANYDTISKAIKMQDETCPGGTVLTFMARNEPYTYDENGGMRLQDLMEVAE